MNGPRFDSIFLPTELTTFISSSERVPTLTIFSKASNDLLMALVLSPVLRIILFAFSPCRIMEAVTKLLLILQSLKKIPTLRNLS
ncbi:hypothetical protein F3Y22_tig00006570pilonHSYRG00191 [Hibiscus syriacus]|uniref:Uncharacterized protein n=1 Tax=Hibiscus syriacus TaxID=106335 RepID=A0A6A3CDI3_HIBSY|nr:hypothetical protein F3Y22_tig00006570pilonHSYRG00191 [Hibiscus syriacus]